MFDSNLSMTDRSPLSCASTATRTPGSALSRFARSSSMSVWRESAVSDGGAAVMPASIRAFPWFGQLIVYSVGGDPTKGNRAPTLQRMQPGLDTVVARARSHTLGDIPRRSARRQPDKIAIIDGDVVLTFAEFESLVDRAAAALDDNGFRPGDRIALLSHNCWQYAVLAFAAARAAVVLVPVNFMLAAEEIVFILGHSKVSGFVVEAELTPTADQAMRLGGSVRKKVSLTAPGQPAAAGW